jgi:hypothetical protein
MLPEVVESVVSRFPKCEVKSEYQPEVTCSIITTFKPAWRIMSSLVSKGNPGNLEKDHMSMTVDL